MIPERGHPPQEIVQTIGHPGQGPVVAHMEGGEHPTELYPTEPAVVRIFKQVFYIIPINKLILQYGGKSQDGQSKDQAGD